MSFLTVLKRNNNDTSRGTVLGFLILWFFDRLVLPCGNLTMWFYGLWSFDLRNFNLTHNIFILKLPNKILYPNKNKQFKMEQEAKIEVLDFEIKDNGSKLTFTTKQWFLSNNMRM